MKNILCLLIFFLHSQSALSLFGTGPEIKATNVCTYCAVDIQMLLNSEDSSYKIPHGSNSVLVIQKLGSMTDVSEKSAVDKLQGRILWFARNETSFSKSVVQKARQHAVNFKLYYQLSVDQKGKLSIFSGRNKPAYELEKEIPHELWGYYQIIDDQPHVLINEYQNLWNADYTVIHELAHMLDQGTADYLEKMKSSNTTWHQLDDVVIEFRAVLAEVQYRKEVKNSELFSSEPLLKKDFRDILMPENEISHEQILNYVLDLLAPVKFKNTTTQQLASAIDGDEQNQQTFVFDVVSEFFKSFFDKLKIQPSTAQVLGLKYKTVQSEQLRQTNRQARAEILAEAQRRGATDLLNYLVKNKLTQALDSATVRSDGRFNQLRAPSPRGGGGSP